MRYLYKKEGTEKFKLWPKKGKDGVVIEKATQLEFYDDKAEKILSRDSFFGHGTGGFTLLNGITYKENLTKTASYERFT